MIVRILLIALGLILVLVSFTDLVNTLVTTSSSQSRFADRWPSRLVGRVAFRLVRTVAVRIPEDRPVRERLLATFGPILLLVLLALWVFLQVVGFGLIWAGIGGLDGADSVLDSIYYSGVSFFTIGFGDVVPVGFVPRGGILIEAFAGVVTTALVIGYLPTLYGAYSDRERALMTIDDGSGDRITPTSLVLAWAPDADPARLDARFAEWERWATSVAETHGSAPMLRLFRSHDRRQNWITALGLLSDAALQAQMIVGASNGSSYWFLRRAETLFSQMTVRADLDEYRAATLMSDEERERVVRELYDRLDRHGFELLPFEMCLDELSALRDMYAPAMEYLIDSLLCPRGFWAPRSSVMPMPSPVTEP
ncbi:MAG: two pore domain potassium channel family protein [Microthrixaceae bacterium]|nr:two pore domain potassium channel family protein [Microthrixaceae bacterium]